MAVTELPFGSLVASNNFVQGDHTKRSAWQNSFFMPSNPNSQYGLFCGPGAVAFGASTITVGPPGSGASNAIVAGSPLAGTTTGVLQVYVDTSGNATCVPVSSTSALFPPVSSVALCFLLLDEVGRIQQILDVRTSYLSSVPDLGSGMKESIAAPTLRAGFVANYYVPRTFSLTPQIPFDLALPAPGFFLGAGAVVISGNTISTAAKYYSTATNGGGLAVNAINQGYVDSTTGAVTIRQVQTSGIFPANSLALFECTTDVVGLIRNLVDWRPSYI